MAPSLCLQSIAMCPSGDPLCSGPGVPAATASGTSFPHSSRVRKVLPSPQSLFSVSPAKVTFPVSALFTLTAFM